jgi:hypothetical protein
MRAKFSQVITASQFQMVPGVTLEGGRLLGVFTQYR